MVFSAALDAGIVLFIAAVFAEYLGIRKKVKGWTWIVVAAVFLIFAGVPVDWATFYGIDPTTMSVVPTIFETVGWVAALIGALYVAYEILLTK